MPFPEARKIVQDQSSTEKKSYTPTPSHATMSTQTVNEPSQQPTNIIEPTTAKAKIPPKPSQNTKSYTRKPITVPQGGSQEPRSSSLGFRPSKGSSDPLSNPQREVIWIVRMYRSHTNQRREYTSYRQNDTFNDFNQHISFFSLFSHHG